MNEKLQEMVEAVRFTIAALHASGASPNDTFETTGNAIEAVGAAVWKIGINHEAETCDCAVCDEPIGYSDSDDDDGELAYLISVPETEEQYAFTERTGVMMIGGMAHGPCMDTADRDAVRQKMWRIAEKEVGAALLLMNANSVSN